ncbi:GNAT family N-acetyltransferase [Ahrensia marina]|uniref:GNAT family N-acetyltransferase n=1 Tax=Ahrensia marina TaxID=1514904 RepID=UPI0006B5A33A|nr:GNAT family N-acetyltransferase [Ahrensia marina]
MSETTPAPENKSPSDAEFIIRVQEKISVISREDWSKLSGTSKTESGFPYNPFISHDFLNALEVSGCAVRETGWLGQHLILEDDKGTIHGVLPGYIKSHSQGEYVFDHAWADAYERAGGRYYPKYQASVPFTPATGPRLLVSNSVNGDAARAALAQGVTQLAQQLHLSSAHVTFAEEADISALKDAGFLHRTDQQFHFHNDNYSSYDDFLGTLASRKRKNLKKERAGALQNNITIEWLTGGAITEEIMDAFFVFYEDTGQRKWGRPYLNRQFYRQIAETMADDILLVMAKRDGRYIAGAINFIGGDTLYGRHWGCTENHPFLHFEVCYHQAIDFAIERGLKFVEAGAQGEHKLARGYMPTVTHSAHYLPNESFRRAVSDYLEHERAEVAHFGTILSNHSPFKKSNNS